MTLTNDIRAKADEIKALADAIDAASTTTETVYENLFAIEVTDTRDGTRLHRLRDNGGRVRILLLGTEAGAQGEADAIASQFTSVLVVPVKIAST